VQTLKSEKRVIEGELGKLASALGEAQSAVADLRKSYNDGRLAAPIKGVVTRLAFDKGSVVRAGEPIVEMNGNHRYVLAYVPTGSMYQVKEGDQVTINTGLQSASGVVARVEPFAAALRREFQRAFTPVTATGPSHRIPARPGFHHRFSRKSRSRQRDFYRCGSDSGPLPY
jgi:multidrug resistance efflux pump